MPARSHIVTAFALCSLVLQLPAVSAVPHIKLAAAKATLHVKPPIKAKQGLPFNVEDARSFFVDYVRKWKNSPKDEFESQEQYDQRHPHWNSKKIVYFQIQPELDGDGANIVDCNYKYDPEQSSLLLGAGNFTFNGGNYNPDDTARLCVWHDEVDNGSYVGANVFNRQVRVNKSTVTDYMLLITNLSDFPDELYNVINSQLQFTRSLSPHDARALARNAQIFVEVQLFDYSDSYYECFDHKKPMIDDPRDVTVYRYSIKAKLLKAILWDRQSQTIIASSVPNQ